MSLVIDFRRLFILGPHLEELPLSSFNKDLSHVHGELIIEWGGRRINCLGVGIYDCCFNNWVEALALVKWELRKSHSASSYIDYEENHPTYLFTRREDDLLLTIVKDVCQKPLEIVNNWENVKVSHADFCQKFDTFHLAFLEELYQQIPRDKHALINHLFKPKFNEPKY